MTVQPPPSLLHPESIVDMLALARETPSGSFVEVGVYKGGSAWHLAQLARMQHRALHLFDTFTGIPNQGPYDVEHELGDFADTSLDAVRVAIPNAIFHPGIFPATFQLGCMGIVAFVHVDCDQYAGTKAAIDVFWDGLPTGAVMLFDDYGHTTGCTKAVDEYFDGMTGVAYLRFTSQRKAFVVKGFPN